MWSGGRSLGLIVLAGVFTGSAGLVTGQNPLCDQQHPGNPELILGAASCFYDGASGETIITLTSGSIIRWDRLALEDSGSRLAFEWAGPPDSTGVVINRVEQGGRLPEFLGGSLSFQDGTLILSHPNSGLTITGEVEAGAITIVTHSLDDEAENQLLNGEAARFSDAHGALVVGGGKVVATSGDVVLAGKSVSILPGPGGESEIRAPAGSVRLFGGQNFRLLPENVPAGMGRIEGESGDNEGNIFNDGILRARGMVEVVAEAGINNAGTLEAESQGGIVMMRVDEGGSILNSGQILADFVSSSSEIAGPGEINPNRGDAPSPLSTGLSRIPVVSRPGEPESSKRVVLRKSAPVTGSASAQRQRANSSRGESSNRNSALATTAARGSGHLARGRSFFGVRGGTKAKKR